MMTTAASVITTCIQLANVADADVVSGGTDVPFPATGGHSPGIAFSSATNIYKATRSRV